MNLLSLSPELLSLIVAAAAAASSSIDRQERWEYQDDPPTRHGTLSSLRLTCSRLSAAATPLLFRTLTLRPAEESIARFHAVLDDPDPHGVRGLVRRVWFESEEERQDDNDDGEPEITELTDEWRAAVARLRELPAVEEVYVRFSPHCAGDDNGTDWYNDFRFGDTKAQRFKILAAVFDAMAPVSGPESEAKSEEQQPCRIRSLSVENLHNVVSEPLVARPSFQRVMNGLEGLHVHVCTEYIDSAPETSLECPEVSAFWPAFTSSWLRPAAATLTSLTLYSDMYFGAVPFWHGGPSAIGKTSPEQQQGIQFPRLKALALGNYAFAYEEQVDWLMSLTELEALMLDDCPIMERLHVQKEKAPYRTRSTPEVYQDRFARSVPSERHKRSVILLSELRWDAVFDGIREKMPLLKQFAMTHGNWYDVSTPSIFYLCRFLSTSSSFFIFFFCFSSLPAVSASLSLFLLPLIPSSFQVCTHKHPSSAPPLPSAPSTPTSSAPSATSPTTTASGRPSLSSRTVGTCRTRTERSCRRSSATPRLTRARTSRRRTARRCMRKRWRRLRG